MSISLFFFLSLSISISLGVCSCCMNFCLYVQKFMQEKYVLKGSIVYMLAACKITYSLEIMEGGG